jgi:hypothetical protein
LGDKSVKNEKSVNCICSHSDELCKYNIISKKLSDMQQKAELLVTSSQGGAERPVSGLLKMKKNTLL